MVSKLVHQDAGRTGEKKKKTKRRGAGFGVFPCPGQRCSARRGKDVIPPLESCNKLSSAL